jgi:hypothetical protein
VASCPDMRRYRAPVERRGHIEHHGLRIVFRQYVVQIRVVDRLSPSVMTARTWSRRRVP